MTQTPEENMRVFLVAYIERAFVSLFDAPIIRCNYRFEADASVLTRRIDVADTEEYATAKRWFLDESRDRDALSLDPVALYLGMDPKRLRATARPIIDRRNEMIDYHKGRLQRGKANTKRNLAMAEKKRVELRTAASKIGRKLRRNTISFSVREAQIGRLIRKKLKVEFHERLGLDRSGRIIPAVEDFLRSGIEI